MISQLPTTLIILISLCFPFSLTLTTLPASPQPTDNSLLCTPFGTCEPCPPEALNEPFCQPFGNRLLLHCIHKPSSSESAQIGEIPAWESCGRLVDQEYADFWEFVICNSILTAIALSLLYTRSKRVAEMQARTLAARIGWTEGRGALWTGVGG